MEISELNVRTYIKKQTNNIAFGNGNDLIYISSKDKLNHIEFNTIYNLYNDFKRLGNEIYDSNEDIVTKIEFHDDKIKFNWPLHKNNNTENELINFLTTKYSFNDERLGLDKINQSEIKNFAELIYLCSDSIKEFSKKNGFAINNEDPFKRIISIYEDEIERAFDYDDLEKIPIIVEQVENSHEDLSKIKEVLEYKDEVILPWITFDHILALFFHFFKLELVYYSHIILGEVKPHLCPKCNRYVTGKCNCINITNNERRNINRKCVELRKELNVLVTNNKERISSTYYREARNMIDGIHRYTDLERLLELTEIINGQIKGN